MAVSALALAAHPALAQDESAAEALIGEVAEAMGGAERLEGLQNLVMTGFGQRVYQNGGGFLTGEAHVPAKWQSVSDAQRSFDLAGGQALNQERRAYQFPFAGEFGLNWARTNELQTGNAMLDHPLTAVLAALDEGTALGPVTVDDGLSIVSFTPEGGAPMWMAVNPADDLPAWVRYTGPSATLGEVAHTVYFTGYLPFDGIMLPTGIQSEMDWRDQVELMFQVDSYRIDVPAEQMPAFPEPAVTASGGEAAPVQVDVTEVATGVWDLRVPGRFGGAGGAVIEMADHLVMFEAYGSEADTLARIDAANELVPGKEVTQVIVSHHHFDHTGGLRAAVSRGLQVIAERGNREIFEEMVSRPAPNFPDAQAVAMAPLDFLPVDGELVLEDELRRVEIYHTLGHLHMADGVFAYLPEEQVLMEGDFSDVTWQFHFWAGGMATNVAEYGLDPAINMPVHGEVTSYEEAQARISELVTGAQDFCARTREAGIYQNGCPVQFDAAGTLPLASE
ncbi:MBL fold metallo-hydrolase [Pseudoroseicyclus sp. CXY001]|uniref:MBL fold metallo-hydrolase n=1 Tax=Pseudoroseicyclus sp. CXY001 TaxID=3242492 RepID=UPI00358DA9C4